MCRLLTRNDAVAAAGGNPVKDAAALPDVTWRETRSSSRRRRSWRT
jgi:hypothetical protein